MKKLFVTILALIYLTTSTSASIHQHYCMGQLAYWGLGQSKSKTCGKCGVESSEEKDNGRCKDEQKFIKSVTDQRFIDADFQLIKLIAVALHVSFVEIPHVNFLSVTEDNPARRAPLRSSGVSVYICNCVFLI